MGVPSFFKWISAKYPLILQQVVDDDLNATSEASRVRIDQGTEAVPISNLYLDCNGIVHPCCHPEGSPAPKDEAEMFANVAALIDRLVATTRPSNVLYLALDGVAPRAKMNQQRTRRFCAAREAVEQEAARRKVGCSEAEKHWGKQHLIKFVMCQTSSCSNAIFVCFESRSQRHHSRHSIHGSVGGISSDLRSPESSNRWAAVAKAGSYH
jgi:5'-3' exonuclease